MKKVLFVLLFFSAIVSGFAQINPVKDGPLANNQYYRKSVELANKAQAAMDAADYDTAAEYAIESQKYAALSRQYIEQALAGMQNRSSPVTESSPVTASGLAAEYEVKYNPADRDCLWKIAGYDFVYGNPREWRRLYDHNRSTFQNPDNPNLVYPGQVLKIPSISGEARSGRR